MNILHISTFDSRGGAARATQRLQQALIDQGVSSQILVLRKESETANTIPVLSVGKTFLVKLYNLLYRKFHKLSPALSFSNNGVVSKAVLNSIKTINPDVVHLHWISGGFIDLEILTKIHPPVVWTLHDDYPYTGGCHIKNTCKRYQSHCQKCPLLMERKLKDLSYRNFSFKMDVYNRINSMHITGVSHWITTCAKQSSLLGSFSHSTIPNGLNTSLFQPLLKKIARKKLDLPSDKQFVLFGAMFGKEDKNKGFQFIIDALDSLKIEDIEIITFGDNEESSLEITYPIHYMGQIDNDKTLCEIYSAADVMVVPSIQESFGQTASEALSCGTPVVAFGATGLLDIVDHKKNGYLAKPYSPKDLANGIEWVLSRSEDEYATLAANARQKVLETFDSTVVAQKYIDLYTTLINKKAPKEMSNACKKQS